MGVSLRKSLPTGFDATHGIRSLRPNDHPKISVKSMTSLYSHNFYLANMLSAGTVHCPSARVFIQGDGGWFFGGHLDDNAVVEGDNYAIGFVFLNETQAPLGFATGQLGSDITRQPQHIDFKIGGRDEWVQQNYFRAIADGVLFKLHASGDLAGLFANLVTDFKNAVNKIEVVFELKTNGAADPGPDQGPTEPPDDTSSEEEG